MMHRASSFMHRGPEVSAAAKSGSPTMEAPVRNIPPNVPVAAGGSFTGDVQIAPAADSNALDTKPDARPGAPPTAPADTTKAPAKK